MQGQWWLSSPLLLPALTFFPGPWATGRLGPALSLTLPSELMFVPFEIYIIEVTLLTLLNYWFLLGGVAGYECPVTGWMNLPGLTSFDAQVKSAQDNMLLPSGYLYPDLDGGIICYFVLQPPYHRGNDG